MLYSPAPGWLFKMPLWRPPDGDFLQQPLTITPKLESQFLMPSITLRDMGKYLMPKLRFLCLILALAGCADQTPSFQANAAGTVGNTAQILGDLNFLFR
jgi:hypothetical protein